ncbi:hypothetical protein PUNSTDRAFT_143010 [Punctularia strigosozonata HHB-11173 SS5]|uniref:uncharacterized protein n=1 Tax=Punctularia strigosozonata (strain HHB-11173) TaxID=741275 RepID=UPI00044169EB|nr:uncharacterized protein PUNSTDRAFT_143010 [Punctularia strigosozonata HHB-11173 SS5]EIN09453.1 hypothetical protein PUNSTDRAFT_143010 [Punctularia strigosozonata HHB-11173 SS5]
MHKASPIFDAPEFPPLRRVKPLPKRRRTSESIAHDHDSLTVLTQDAATRELIAQAASLSSRYYVPPIIGLGDEEAPSSGNDPPLDFGLGEGRGGGHDDDEQGDGDYVDHLQQPGNTKKRKEEESPDRVLGPESRSEADTPDLVPYASSPKSLEHKQKARMSRATLAGLQQKEVLKLRKRQLAPVLNSIVNGDPLSLDQALVSSYPFAKLGFGADGKLVKTPKVRLSRRGVTREARALRSLPKALPAPGTAPPPHLPDVDFTFNFRVASSDRQLVVEREVASLQKRFEAELKRQLAKAADAAKQAAAALADAARPKQPGRLQNRARLGITDGKIEQNASTADASLSGAGGAKKKKKKRSALANASNPHHLRNYVPSRLPSSGTPNNAQTNAQNYLGPPPLRFLSAMLPERAKSAAGTTPSPAPLTDPAGEWICASCEYNLFYGDDAAFRRALRQRKKILRRKRRARERAAAAASGNTRLRSERPPPEEELEAQFEPGYAEQVAAMQQQFKSKGERNKGEGRDGLEHAASGHPG